MNKNAYARLRPLTREEIDDRQARLDNDAAKEEGLSDKAHDKKKEHDGKAESLIAQLRGLVRNRATGKPVYLLLDDGTTTEKPDGQEELAFDDEPPTEASTKKTAKIIDADVVKGPAALPAGGVMQGDNLAVYNATAAGSKYAAAQEQSGGPWALLIDGVRDTREFATSSEAMAAGDAAARTKLKWKAFDRSGKPWRPGKQPAKGKPRGGFGPKGEGSGPVPPKKGAAKPKGKGAPKKGGAGKAARKPKQLPPGAPGATGEAEGGTPPEPSGDGGPDAGSGPSGT